MSRDDVLASAASAEQMGRPELAASLRELADTITEPFGNDWACRACGAARVTITTAGLACARCATVLP